MTNEIVVLGHYENSVYIGSGERREVNATPIFIHDTIEVPIFYCPRCPSKADGRRGTRRAWKQMYPPGEYTLQRRITTYRDGKKETSERIIMARW